MKIKAKKADGNEIEIDLSNDENGNPKWKSEDSIISELFNILTEQSLLLGETDLDHPLSNYRSPSNPNEYSLINHIIVELLGWELISPTFDDFIATEDAEENDIVY